MLMGLASQSMRILHANITLGITMLRTRRVEMVCGLAVKLKREKVLVAQRELINLLIILMKRPKSISSIDT
jgi:hypothetical protein